ncbi:serine hydrolase [Zobellia uliginosa]|uniref:serine hydrolase n=1 Tax=Zobellia uliginosa TaxID=143224 RepID=UPI000970327D|nr:serine hydrolase [Zobellia uliginosa]
MFKSSFLIGICFLFLFSCAPKEPEKGNAPLEFALGSDHPKIKRVMDSLAAYEIQIRYTQIHRKGRQIDFTDFDFQVDTSKYFYPASTVKFPIAVTALEKLNETKTLDLNTRFYIEGDSVETTFSEAISQIFTVSDNQAANRLIDFLGQDSINHRLHRRGVSPVRIWQRLDDPNDNVTTTPLIIYENDSTISMRSPLISAYPKPLDLHGIYKGKGFYDDEGTLIPEPFDFSLKNYYPISAQHDLLKRIIFPERFDSLQRFALSEGQRSFLLKAMHTLPRQAGYDPAKYHDGYSKFFMYGDTTEEIPEHIEIYNKVGFAYGTLTDCAYIKDTKNKVEFMLTATILVNKNGIFNDDTYEYKEIGLPFLAELGRQLYAYELMRLKQE